VDRPTTSYARCGELAIAFQVHGSGPHDLMVSGATASNGETQWQLPEARQMLERLGGLTRVIRYDRRDTGLSDPVSEDLTLEAQVEDAIAVMDAVGAERPVLIGAVDGARSLALLAATRPERVGGLILLAPTATGTAVNSPEVADAVVRNVADPVDWPRPVLELLVPEWMVDPVRSDRLVRYLQTACTPRQGARVLKMSLLSDISAALPLVQAPTIAILPRDLKVVSADAVRRFADLIPGARLREVPGAASFLFAADVEVIAGIVEEMLSLGRPIAASNRILATVLFTDLVDSTGIAATSGDRAWSELLGRHLDLARTAVAAHGGETVKSTGDGVLALFAGPGQGVRCAQRITAESEALGLKLRSGLHCGEVERSSDDVAGLAVHLAARIMSQAEAGEVLVSGTVHDLVIGSELAFSERGEHELKGIPGRWAVYGAI
jgi:class 3 adenylate cyclase